MSLTDTAAIKLSKRDKDKEDAPLSLLDPEISAAFRGEECPDRVNAAVLRDRREPTSMMLSLALEDSMVDSE